MAKEQIRKQIYDLSAQDFLEHLIWEFCSDEEDVEDQDEATVKPSEDLEVPGYSPGVYVVAADVTFGNGARGEGYLYSGPPDDISCVQPNILLPTGQVNLWLGRMQYTIEWDARVSSSMNLLGRDEELFPMTFDTKTNVNGAPLKVKAEGFLALTPEGLIIRIY
ncbi:hypothetical protein [Granulicella paludicola]|uniref:hypothetical protein n=1 Tax=Granulicella paludicola TaxID=474951 RepID=UPI0021DF8D52|nr:hypothetical protein [Granulicella paludicola]